MFKWTLSAEASALATPSDVWDIWTEVSSWPEWNRALEWSILDGSFKLGTRGKIKPKGWPISDFQISAIDDKKGFSSKAYMPKTKMIFKYSTSTKDDSQVTITHHVEISGLLSPLLWLTMRRKLKKGLPISVEKLALLAQERAIERISS